MVLCCARARWRADMFTLLFCSGKFAALHGCSPYGRDQTCSALCTFLGLGQEFCRKKKAVADFPKDLMAQHGRTSVTKGIKPKGQEGKRAGANFYLFSFLLSPLDFDFTLLLYPNASTTISWIPQSLFRGTLFSPPPGSTGVLAQLNLKPHPAQKNHGQLFLQQ